MHGQTEPQISTSQRMILHCRQLHRHLRRPGKVIMCSSSPKLTRKCQEVLAASTATKLKVLEWNTVADGLEQHGGFVKAGDAWHALRTLALLELRAFVAGGAQTADMGAQSARHPGAAA